MAVKKLTTDQITVVKPPTRLQLLSHRPHCKYALFIARFAGLNLPGETQVNKIERTSILNNDSMVACGFLG